LLATLAYLRANPAILDAHRLGTAMIIARSPLRITLGGGGTDLASYYERQDGFMLAAAIDKYAYVTVTRPFTPGIYLKHSALEHVEKVADVRHPIIREAGWETSRCQIRRR
jgi:galactokinase/mevalonate kinase-like predicted kinase